MKGNLTVFDAAHNQHGKSVPSALHYLEVPIMYTLENKERILFKKSLIPGQCGMMLLSNVKFKDTDKSWWETFQKDITSHIREYKGGILATAVHPDSDGDISEKSPLHDMLTALEWEPGKLFMNPNTDNMVRTFTWRLRPLEEEDE